MADSNQIKRRYGQPPTCHPKAKHRAKGLCKPCYERNYKRDPIKRRESNKRRYARRNETRRVKDWELGIRFRYGLTKEEYDQKLAGQGGGCAICKAEHSGNSVAPRLAVDHNHITKEIRGLLCRRCNLFIGFLENTSLYEQALRYLKLWEERIKWAF